MPASDLYELKVSGCRRRVISGALLAIALIGMLCLAGCSRGRKNTPTAGAPGKLSTQPKAEQPKPESTLKVEFGKARILWNDATGRRILDAQFKEAVVSQTGKNAALELKGVKASLYKNGKIASTMAAPRVVADSRTREVKASGGVKVTSAADGATAISEQLVWKAREDRVYGTGMVKMLKGNMFINARSFQADTALKKAHFTEAELGMN